MRKKLEINSTHMSYNELKQLYGKCNDAKLKIKLLAILQTWDGQTSLEVAANLHKSDSSIRRWIHSFNQYGVSGLHSRTHSNRKSYLSEDQKALVKEVLQKSPRENGFNRSNWSMSLLALWIKKQFSIKYHPGSLYKLVRSLGFTLQRPKKESYNADPELQKQFKQELRQLLKEKDNNTVVLYQDEAIITDEPTTVAKWALKGNQPIVPTNSKGSRKRKVLFGAVNPETGDVYYRTYDKGNSESFKSFLK